MSLDSDTSILGSKEWKVTKCLPPLPPEDDISAPQAQDSDWIECSASTSAIESEPQSMTRLQVIDGVIAFVADHYTFSNVGLSIQSLRLAATEGTQNILRYGIPSDISSADFSPDLLRVVARIESIQDGENSAIYLTLEFYDAGPDFTKTIQEIVQEVEERFAELVHGRGIYILTKQGYAIVPERVSPQQKVVRMTRKLN